MKNNGLIRVHAVSPTVSLGNIQKNTQQMIEIIKKTDAHIIVFPALSVTGAGLEDLYAQPIVVEKSMEALKSLCKATAGKEKIVVVGLPMMINYSLCNVAVALCNGKLLGACAKSKYDTNDSRCFHQDINETEISIFNEFMSVDSELILDNDEFRLGLSLNEDLSDKFLYHADIIIQPAAMPSTVGSKQKLHERLAYLSSKSPCAIIYANTGTGESSSYHVYDGYCCAFENGSILAAGERFSQKGSSITCDVDWQAMQYRKSMQKAPEMDAFGLFPMNFSAKTNNNLLRPVTRTPFLRNGEEYLQDMLSMQSIALCSRLQKINCEKVVIGLSGGLDSSVCLLASYLAYQKAGMDTANITCITMPGFGTGKQTKNNAQGLLEALQLQALNIDITQSVRQHFKDIGHDESILDITYENAQARERTQILMDYANKIDGIVLGTGDMSELALGFCTYNGDHMSMYSMNAGIPKTALKPYLLYLAKQISPVCVEVCEAIVSTPISPELLPTNDGELQQKTESILGSYELHDFFLYHFIEHGYSKDKLLFFAKQVFSDIYSEEEIKNTLQTFFSKFFSQQFKRNCTPDGIAVYGTSLSPHKAWKMPSDVYDSLWK